MIELDLYDMLLVDALKARSVKQNNGQVSRCVWDSQSAYGDVILETDAAAPVTSCVLGGTRLISQTRGGNTSYYLADGQGSTRLLTDVSNGITDSHLNRP